MKEIFIVVRGGLIEEVLSNEDIEVTIVDFDEIYRTEEESKGLTKFIEQKREQLKTVYGG